MYLMPEKKPQLDEDLKALLIAGEKPEKLFRFQETQFLFTNRRLLVRQGTVEQKTPASITCIPYRSVVQFRLLNPTDGLTVLRLYVSGAEPGEYPLTADDTLPSFLTALSESLVNRQPLWLEKHLARKRREAWRPLQMALIGTAAAMVGTAMVKKRLKSRPADQSALKQALRKKLLQSLKPS